MKGMRGPLTGPSFIVLIRSGHAEAAGNQFALRIRPGNRETKPIATISVRLAIVRDRSQHR